MSSAPRPRRRRSLLLAIASLLPWTATLLASVVAGCAHDPDADFQKQVRRFEDDSHDDGDGKLHAFLVPMASPRWVGAAEASHMRPDDPVVGFLTAQHAYALPWWILKNHHVANLELDGVQVLITLCERCSSAAAFDPVVDGVRHTFRVVGIYNGTHILEDDQSRSLVTPFLGEGMTGALKGRHLVHRRIDQATWADWLELHPDTQVVWGEAAERTGHGSEDAPGAPGLGANMRKSILHPDARRPENELVLGVVAGGAARAYPVAPRSAAAPNDGPNGGSNGGPKAAVIQDELGGVALVVLQRPGSWLAATFLREVAGRRLDFAVGDDGAIRDEQTHSRWNLAGEAKEGELRGQRLEPVQYGLEEWYIWATQHPETTIHGVDR